jgi:GTPase
MDKTSTLSESTIPKETQNIVVKRDTVRKKELVCVLFCGHVDAGKSTIESQLV